MREPVRGIVISNCQSQPLKHILSLFCDGIAFDGFGVHVIPPEAQDQAVMELVDKAQRDYDVILSIPLSDEFGPIALDQLRQTFSRQLVATIPNFYFSGLHPDLTYIGDLGTRIVGPLEDYHSKIAVFGYVSGFTIDECLKLYRDDVYREIGYYEEFARSFAELRRRDAGLDVPFSDELQGLLKTDLCFFSVNHPTSFLFAGFCAKLAAWLEGQGVGTRVPWPWPVSGLPNHLAQHVLFPIYPEVAAACDLSFPGTYVFKGLTIGDDPAGCIGLAEFVAGEYRGFEQFGRDQLLKARQVQSIVETCAAFSIAYQPARAVPQSGTGQTPPGTAVDLVLGFRPENMNTFIWVENGRAVFNVSPLAQNEPLSIGAAVVAALENAKQTVTERGLPLVANVNYEILNDDVTRAMADGRLDLLALDRVLAVIATFTADTRDHQAGAWLRPSHPDFDLESQQAVHRYGNVELKVIENFLLDRPGLKDALVRVVSRANDEQYLYRPGNPTNYLAADDIEWNVRMLMTNAGFYFGGTVEQAWSDLCDWAGRYIAAMMQGYLATFPPAYPFFFKVQRVFSDRFGYSVRYVAHPSPMQIYENLKGKEVLFVSPLAYLAAEQVASGRLRQLYRNYAVPDFTLSAIPAWVSTWPNRPHNGWSETFRHLCTLIDQTFETSRPEIFMAACGCYGLPLCEYVRSNYRTKTLYLGNIAHAYFGIRQHGTRDFMKGETNPEAWVDSDLGRFVGLSRIDDGRYV